MQKNNKLLTLYLFLSIVYIFFSTTNTYINYFLLVLLSFLTLLLLKNNKIIKKDLKITLWLLFLFFCIISIFSPYNTNILNGIYFISCAILFLLEYYVLTQGKHEWIEKFIRYLNIFSTIFAFATLIQIFLPDLIDKIKLLYLQTSKIYLSRKFILSDSLYSGYNGLVVQTGTNAYLLSMFVGTSMFKFLKEKTYKIKNLLFIILGIVLIILTSKRTLLLATAFSILLMYLIYKKFNIKYIVITIFVAILSIFVIFNYTTIGDKILQKFTMSQENVLSGRDILYEKMNDNFKLSPLIGVGIDSKINGQDGHNIYLQVASETGIFGILVFIIFIIYNLMNTLVYLNKDTNYKQILALSFYMQIIFIIWGITGNPLYDQFALLSYIIFLALGTTCINKIKGEVKVEKE